jgi:molybdate transport repressor ModE-like protein
LIVSELETEGATLDRLRCIEVFIEVARTGSFAAAARHLGMSRPAVTKHVARLEDLLGARLLNRTTKQVGLTEAGHLASTAGRQLLERFDAIEADVRESTRMPRGVVRVGTPPAFGTYHMVPLIAEFAERHPDIQVVLSLDTGDANLVAQGLDLSVRITQELEDASHVAQPLAKAPQVLVAAPDYLARHGAPRGPADLARHNCLVHVIKSPTGIWRFTGPQGPASVRVRGTIASNFGDALMHAALRGYGISMHPYYMVSQWLEQGRLVPVLRRVRAGRARRLRDLFEPQEPARARAALRRVPARLGAHAAAVVGAAPDRRAARPHGRDGADARTRRAPLRAAVARTRGAVSPHGPGARRRAPDPSVRAPRPLSPRRTPGTVSKRRETRDRGRAGWHHPRRWIRDSRSFPKAAPAASSRWARAAPASWSRRPTSSGSRCPTRAACRRRCACCASTTRCS